MTMLLRHLVSNRLDEIKTHPSLRKLYEDAGLLLKAAADAAKTDRSKLEKFDIESLADVITAIRILTNPDYCQAITKREVGIDPNNAAELLSILDTIPNDPTKVIPSKTKEFIRAVAFMSKSLRQKELAELKLIFGPNTHERQHAIIALQKLSVQVIKALDRLRDHSHHPA